MKIRNKILSGFMILVAMLLGAASISIYQFNNLSLSVQALIDNNYKTIQACEDMLEALEREDSGILLLLLGKWKQGREMITSADESFRKSLEITTNNITEEGEDKLVADVEKEYEVFKSEWDRPIVGTPIEGNLNWYFENQYNSFLSTKRAIEKLLLLNQRSMYNSTSKLKERAKRALMPSIVAIIAALLFVIMFNTFINAYFIRPITEMKESIDRFKKTGQISEVKAESKDELGILARSINDFLFQLKSPEK